MDKFEQVCSDHIEDPPCEQTDKQIHTTENIPFP